MSHKLNSAIAVIGIDIGKNSFHAVGYDKRGAIVLRQKWSRGQVEARLANVPPCLIGMEACVGAHHLSRKLQALGHDARLMPAKYVRPYSKGQKNDFRDAEAITEAVPRPTMKFVATKTADQLDLQALHRVRERLVGQRTGIINQMRAFLLERGVAVRKGPRFLRAELPAIVAKRTDMLSPCMLHLIEGLAEDWRRLDERIETLSNEINALARKDSACDRLMSVPGIGPIIASAMVAAIGTGEAFAKGRDFGAWLGLVPKQISTGDRCSCVCRGRGWPAESVRITVMHIVKIGLLCASCRSSSACSRSRSAGLMLWVPWPNSTKHSLIICSPFWRFNLVGLPRLTRDLANPSSTRLIAC
jgi:transposase